MTPPLSSSEPTRCERCGRPSMEWCHANKDYSEEPCTPQRCDVWRVVGLSRNGGPLLRIVGDE